MYYGCSILHIVLQIILQSGTCGVGEDDVSQRREIISPVGNFFSLYNNARRTTFLYGKWCVFIVSYAATGVVVMLLELWSSSNECLTSFVGGVLLEVLDEACCEVLSLLFPLACAVVGVA